MRLPRFTMLLIALVVLFPAAIWTYDRPTDEQLAGNWEDLTREERFAQLRKLDDIEHTEPTTSHPQQVIVQTDDGVIMSYFLEPLIIDIAGHLRYSIELPSGEIQGARRASWWKPAGIGLSTGFVVGAVLMLFFLK